MPAVRDGAPLPNVASECGRQFGIWRARRYPGLGVAEIEALYEVWQSAWATGAWAALRDNSDLGLLMMQAQEKLDALTSLIRSMERPPREED